jgi:hypothetical protein
MQSGSAGIVRRAQGPADVSGDADQTGLDPCAAEGLGIGEDPAPAHFGAEPSERDANHAEPIFEHVPPRQESYLADSGTIDLMRGMFVQSSLLPTLRSQILL